LAGYRKPPSASYSKKRVHSIVSSKLKKATKQSKVRQVGPHLFVREPEHIRGPVVKARAQGLFKPKASTISPQQFVQGKPKSLKPFPFGNVPSSFSHDSRGFVANFRSKSTPNAPPYETIMWTTTQGQFKPGDVSCNCNGYKFNQKCHHCDDMVADYRAVNPNDPTVFTSKGRQL